jgi:hypothetical protein
MSKLSIDSQIVQNFTYTNGLLRYKGKLYIGDSGHLKQQLLASFHNSALGGHSGERATYQRLKLNFYWLKLKKQLTEFVKQCAIFQKNKSKNIPYPGLLQPLPLPDMAWTHISMDLIEGLPKSQSKDVILVVVDRLSKYAHFIALSHPYNASDIAQLFLDNVFKLHGLPKVILTDRDPIFTSTIWQSLFKAMGVQLHLTSAYHPKQMGKLKESINVWKIISDVCVLLVLS